MSETATRSSKRRRLNSPSTVYQSETVKKQKHFSAKRRTIRRVIPETPEKKRQKTLTQAQWFESGRDSQEEDGGINPKTSENDGHADPAATASAANKQTAKRTKAPRRRRVTIATASDDDSDSEYGVTCKGRKRKIPKMVSRSQSTLTQLDDFWTGDTVLSGRSGTPGSSAARRKKKESSEEQRQRTLTQMLEVTTSDEEEVGIIEDEVGMGENEAGVVEEEGMTEDEAGRVEVEVEDDAHSVTSDAVPMASNRSPASKDALRVPEDIKQARKRTLLATQITQNQENVDPDLASPGNPKITHPNPYQVATPQKQKRREIPSSQSPASCALSTERTERFINSPMNARIRDIIEETPSKQRRTRRVLFSDPTLDSSRESTQIKEEPLSSINDPASSPTAQPTDRVDTVQENDHPEDATPRQGVNGSVTKVSSARKVVPSSQEEEGLEETQVYAMDDVDEPLELSDGPEDNILVVEPAATSRPPEASRLPDETSEEEPMPLKNLFSRRSNNNEAEDNTTGDQQGQEHVSIDLDSPIFSRHTRKPPSLLSVSDNPSPAHTKPTKPISLQCQSSHSSQAEAQLHAEMQTYTQRSSLPKPPARQMLYPSQATTVDITQATQHLPSTAVPKPSQHKSSQYRASQHIPPLSTAVSSEQSLVRPPDLVIPSSPMQMLPPPMSSPPAGVEMVEDSQGIPSKGKVMQFSLGLWSLPPPPEWDSDVE